MDLMRQSGSWQSVWDDRILEVAYTDEDNVISVSDLDDHPGVRTSKSNISKRCGILAEHGLLRRIGNGVYLLTEEGKGYLNEEYDADQGVWIDGNHGKEGSPSEGDTPTGPTGPNGA